MLYSMPCASVLTIGKQHYLNVRKVPDNEHYSIKDIHIYLKRIYGIKNKNNNCIVQLPYVYNLTIPSIAKIYDINYQYGFKENEKGAKERFDFSKEVVEICETSHFFDYSVGDEEAREMAKDFILKVVNDEEEWGILYNLSDDFREQGCRTYIEKQRYNWRHLSITDNVVE